jgi:hypothetical protein
MYPNHIGLVAVWWWQRLARKRFLSRIETMAEKGQNEIDGQSVEHWLNILNRDMPWTLVSTDAKVLVFKGREWFFDFLSGLCR